MTPNPLDEMGRRATAAARVLATTPTETKNRLLQAIADGLTAHEHAILDANVRDLEDARKAGLRSNLIDRMTLTPARLQGIASDTLSVAALPDPVGEEFDGRVLPNGLRVKKRITPLGVIGLIYEARPNVTVDIAALSLKTGNAAIMRGSSEIRRSNLAIMAVIREALLKMDLPADAVQYIKDPDRALVGQLLKLDQYVDMIIPRGGAGLHDYCRQNSTIPVITGGIGINHVFVDTSANLKQAVPIIHNAKTQRPSVCNALDTVLVHEAVAEALLPKVVDRLARDGVSFRAEERALAIIGEHPAVAPAGPDDFDTEWLSLVLGLKVVSGLDEALEHIRLHATHHSDSILTNDWGNAQRFLDEVDSAAVYVNASTRFTDGGQLGLGAEVAVSTQKLHARGPMGLKELTTYKWIILGDGHVRT
ncbi:MAG: glutamate-5-semialdehyde dehydrogenase [Clostridia bacterium]|nr:MAG: glutamate-5-semialdehyde dehydrogenase [Clostridia bacterium]